jgi:hypothetical protein
LDDLIPSSDLENKIDVGNTERSDYENPLLNTVPEILPIELASDGYANYLSLFCILNYIHPFSSWFSVCD